MQISQSTALLPSLLLPALGCISPNTGLDHLPQLRGDLCFLESRQKSLAVRHAMTRKFAGELQVLFSARNMLGYGQVMDLETQSRHSSCIGILDPYESVAPSTGKNGSPLAHTLRVVAEELMKRRTLTDAAIDQIRQFWTVQREQIRLGRHQQRRRCIGKLTENRLTADHHDFRIV